MKRVPFTVRRGNEVWRVFPQQQPLGRFQQVHLSPEEQAVLERLAAEQRVAATPTGVEYGKGSVGGLLRALAAGAVRLMPPVVEVPVREMVVEVKPLSCVREVLVHRGCPVDMIDRMDGDGLDGPG